MNLFLQNNEHSFSQSHPPTSPHIPQHQASPPFKITILCSYLYFIQGIILSLPATMPLIYKQLPSYSKLSLFSAAFFPFSFKFIFAPFAQKFAIISYGKRKTWIILSQLMASFMLFLGSFFMKDTNQTSLGWIFIVTVSFVTMQDISLDAMAIKEMKIPHLVGRTQTIMQTGGFIIGSLVFLKGCSTEFANSLGFSQPFFHAQTLMRGFSFSILIPTIIIHFTFEETILESEREMMKKTFGQIIKKCRMFIDLQSKYCRVCLFFMIYSQGFHFFSAGYEYELVIGGFKKNTINTINNISLIPVSFLILFLSSHIRIQKWSKFMHIQMITRWIFYFFLLLSFPDLRGRKQISAQEASSYLVFQNWFVTIVVLIIQFLDTLAFLLSSILVNSFPVLGLSGLYITLLNSSANFGNLKTLHLQLIDLFGWKNVSWFGLCIQCFIIVMFPRIFDQVMKGKIANQSISENVEIHSEENMKQVDGDSDQKIQSCENFSE